MAARPAADLHPHTARRKVQIVVHDNDLPGLVAGERRPRVVHKRRGFEESDVLEADSYRGGISLFLRTPGTTVAAGELIGDEKANVVTSTFVGAAGVAKAHNHGRRRGCSQGLFVGIPAWAEAEEARQLKVGDSVLRGLLPPREKPLR